MEPRHLAVGLIYIVLPTVFIPFQIRIIHIYLVHSEFKSLECYRIMAMISISHVSYGLCFIPFGVSIMTQNDLHGLAVTAFKLWASSWAAVLALDLSLAINRLRLVCQIHILQTISKYLPYMAFLYPTFFFIIMITPWAGAQLLTENVYFGYDLAKPFSSLVSYIHGYHNIICVTGTALVYIAMSMYLFVLKFRYKSTGMATKEWMIIIRAIIKFLANMVVLVTMNFFSSFFQQTFWMLTIIPIYQIFNLLVLPLFVHICFNRTLQTHFFRQLTPSVKVWASSVPNRT